MKKLYICGLQGQGKGLLRQLLDGHPEIFSPGFICCPGISLLNLDFISRSLPRIDALRAGKQDILYQCFTQGDVSINVDGRIWTVSVGDIWNQLLKNGFYNLLIDVSFSDWSSLIVDESNSNNQVKHFSFVEFLNDSIQEIVKKKYFESLEQLQDTIYKCFVKHYKASPHEYSDESYFLQISLANGYPPIEAISKNNVNKKILIVDREPVSSAFMNAERLVDRKPEMRNKKKRMYERIAFSFYEGFLYSNGYIDKFNDFHTKLNSLRQTDEDIYVVDFDQMILNTKETMNEIAAYLGIKKNPIMYKATLNGMPISSPNGNFDVGKIMHDPYRVLSKRQIQMLSYLFNGWNSDLSFVRNISLALNSLKLDLVYNKWIRKTVKMMVKVLKIFKKG